MQITFLLAALIANAAASPLSVQTPDPSQQDRVLRSVKRQLQDNFNVSIGTKGKEVITLFVPVKSGCKLGDPELVQVEGISDDTYRQAMIVAAMNTVAKTRQLKGLSPEDCKSLMKEGGIQMRFSGAE